MALTKKDMENMKKIFATKDDLKNFATKKELFAVETKLDNKIEDLRTEMNAKFNTILTGQDQILSKLEAMSMDLIVFGEQHKRHDAKLEDHEKRIATLETQPSR